MDKIGMVVSVQRPPVEYKCQCGWMLEKIGYFLHHGKRYGPDATRCQYEEMTFDCPSTAIETVFLRHSEGGSTNG